MQKSRWRFIVLLCALFGVFYFLAYRHGVNLRKEHYVTNAIITECGSGGRGNQGPIVYYRYFDETNKKWVNSSRHYKSLKYAIQDLVGHPFPVVYNNAGFINNDMILITPAQFKTFKMPFPDSLNWVIGYFVDEERERYEMEGYIDKNLYSIPKVKSNPPYTSPTHN